MSDTAASNPEPQAQRVSGGRLAIDVVLYTAARLALVVVLFCVIFFGGELIGVTVPLLVAALFALCIALPLSMVLFTKLRANVNEGIAAIDAQRRADRATLHARFDDSASA